MINKSIVRGVSSALLFTSFAAASAESDFEIKCDQKMVQNKKAYLDSLSRNTESKVFDRPNIIFIIVDDLGKTDTDLYSSLGCNVAVPNLRKLAETGVICDEAYCSAPISSPSRAGIITGRQQQRFGFEYRIATLYPHSKGFKNFVEKNVNLGNLHMNDLTAYPSCSQMKQQGLPDSEITAAELFKAAGYSTAMIGKWDLGYRDNMVPEKSGFDYSYDFLEAFTLYDRINDPDIVNSRQDNYQNDFIWSRKRMGTCAIRRQGKRIKEDEYLTFAMVRETVDFIAQNKEDPFFVYLSFNAPHTPFQVPRRYYNMFPDVKDHNKRVYYGMIKALDDAIGDIMNYLDREGLRENTLICFASDNGGAEYTEATTNRPLKGGKFSNFEGGLNVPYIISWPKRMRLGGFYSRPVSTLDFFVTAANAAGIKDLPGDRVYDGVNLLPFLNGTEVGDPHEALFWRASYNKSLRSGDWKYIFDEKHGKELLYNLEIDKNEQVNLADKNPSQAAVFRKMYREWESGVMAPLWPYLMDYYYEIDGELFYFAL